MTEHIEQTSSVLKDGLKMVLCLANVHVVVSDSSINIIAVQLRSLIYRARSTLVVHTERVKSK